MGLAWNGQLELIKEDSVLSSTMHVTCIVAEDEKKRTMVCLPLQYLDGWLSMSSLVDRKWPLAG